MSSACIPPSPHYPARRLEDVRLKAEGLDPAAEAQHQLAFGIANGLAGGDGAHDRQYHPSYLTGQTLGNARMAQLAMIETSDAISPDCLTAVGQYRSGRTQNSAANNSLVTSQFDTSDATNSEVQQLNLLNAAEAQKMAEMQSQGSLQVCLAGQMAGPVLRLDNPQGNSKYLPFGGCSGLPGMN